MKHYLIKPKMKKSIVEREFFRRTNEEGVVEIMEMETGWRWGSFVISVPDTPEDIESMLEYYTEDYDATLVDTDDGCWVTFEVRIKDMDDEEYEALIEEIEDAYEEDGYEGLERLGWMPDEIYYELYNGFTLTECDEHGDPL